MASFAHCGSRVLLVTFMIASMLELVVCSSSATTPPPTPIILLQVDGPYTPVEGNLLGTIKIYDDMHYEFDVSVANLSYSSWVSLLYCYDTARWPVGDTLGQPGIWLHPQSTGEETLHMFGALFEEDAGVQGSAPVGNVQKNTTYHFAMNVTQSQLSIRINGEKVYDESKDAHILSTNVSCYSSAPGFAALEGNMSNVLITTHNTSAASTTAEPTENTAEITNTTTTGANARSIEKEQNMGYDVIDSGDAAEDSQDLAALLAASLAFVAVVVIGVALFYALRSKNGKAEKVSDEMIVEEDVPDATVEMVVEAPVTM